MLNEWLITYNVRGQQISIKVNSNNEFCAREKAKMKLLMQYHHLHLQSNEYKIISARLIKKY